MKRKVRIVFLIVFLLLAVFAGYKFFSAELDFKTESDYYDTLADTWVKPSTSETESAKTGAVPAQAGSADVQAELVPARADSSPAQTELMPALAESVPVQADPAQTKAESAPARDESKKTQGTASPVQSESVSAGGQPASESNTPYVTVEATQSAAESPAPESPAPGLTAEPHAARYTAAVIEKGRTTAEQPPISVDFEGLRGENPDIVGWIYCEDTPINYPVLQGEDNRKYLTVQPDGRTSGSGSVFIDCNCESEFISDNTIMYGHNLKNKMFASLSKYSSQTYYDRHSVMWLLTPGENYKIELFAGFVIKDGGWVYVIDLPFPGDWEEFTEACLKHSYFRSAYQPEKDDRLITLSTCDYSFDNARYVVIGSLIRSVKD